MGMGMGRLLCTAVGKGALAVQSQTDSTDGKSLNTHQENCLGAIL